MEREFNLAKTDAAQFLRDLADSIEKGSIALDGEDWKVYHETDSKVPMRIFSDDNGTEIGLKMLKKDNNQV